jgi:hypothetical protein
MTRALLVLVTACSSSPSSTGPAKPPGSGDTAACSTDDDCTLVEACCGCSASGKRIAIRKDAVADFDRTRPKRCGGSTCAQAISTHSSCTAEAVCRESKCAVQPHMHGN